MKHVDCILSGFISPVVNISNDAAVGSLITKNFFIAFYKEYSLNQRTFQILSQKREHILYFCFNIYEVYNKKCSYIFYN